MSEPDAHEPADETSDVEPPEVAEAAAADVTTARLAALLEHASPLVRAAVVANEKAPDALFGDTWQDPGDDVRSTLISHRAHLIPTYAFPALANDPDTRVRGAALRKLPMPESLLLELARHPDQRVRRSAVKNPGATPEVQRTCDAYEAPLKKYAVARPEVGRCAHGAVVTLADGETAAAHVGGAVQLPEGWAWPSCRTCAEPMLLLLSAELGDVPTWVRAGSRWVFFVCKQHGDVPAAPDGAGAPLGAKFWERSDGHYAALLFRPGEATVRHEARMGLAPKKLELSVGVESLEEVGPLTGRYFVGSQGWKLGGYPSWCQSPVELTCACGAELGLLGQVPENTRLELADGSGTFSPFLGCETYVMACTKQCDPNAVVVVAQE